MHAVLRGPPPGGQGMHPVRRRFVLVLPRRHAALRGVRRRVLRHCRWGMPAGEHQGSRRGAVAAFPSEVKPAPPQAACCCCCCCCCCSRLGMSPARVLVLRQTMPRRQRLPRAPDTQHCSLPAGRITPLLAPPPLWRCCSATAAQARAAPTAPAAPPACRGTAWSGAGVYRWVHAVEARCLPWQGSAQAGYSSRRVEQEASVLQRCACRFGCSTRRVPPQGQQEGQQQED